MKTIECEEGRPFTIESTLVDRLRKECARLQTVLRPSFPILSEGNGQFKLSGIVGTVCIGANAYIKLAPKTTGAEDWVHATLDLLIGSDRVDVAGERAAGLSPHRRDLLEVLAAIYSARLERAIRRDGPILLMRSQRSTEYLLKGKLDVTEWAKSAIWRPNKFPIEYGKLSPDHEFSRGLAKVAHILARLSRSSETRGRLLTAAAAIRPSLPEGEPVLELKAFAPLPAQWSIYAPAWSIAKAILSRQSLLRSRGQQHGISIVVETWPLLERLLDRALLASVSLASSRGTPDIRFAKKRQIKLLANPEGGAKEERMVEPDGRLLDQSGKTVATFEAKYKRIEQAARWPDREDLYQALVAAAACESPLAILVYPESFSPARWQVLGLNNRPLHLVAIGLGLFSYRRGEGDLERARLVLDILDGNAFAPSVESPSPEGILLS